MPNEQASSAVYRLRGMKARNVALGPNQKKSFGRGNRAGMQHCVHGQAFIGGDGSAT